MTVGSIGPNSDLLVTFETGLSPSEVKMLLQSDYAEHRGADGVTRLEALAERPADVSFPITLVPVPRQPAIAGTPVAGDDPESAERRLERLDLLRLRHEVSALFLGDAWLGDFVVTGLRVTYRDPARRYIDVEVSLLEYDGSTTDIGGERLRASAVAAAAVTNSRRPV